ncbi:MAG: hypothetical protein ACREDR_38985, partial [Blastocatellia bacterium]
MKVAKLLTAATAVFLSICFMRAGTVPASGRAIAPTEPANFCADIAPILQRRCQECHRDGGIGPMPLVTYQETRPYSRDIAEMVLKRLMPPFHAGGQLGRYVGDPRLTESEIAKIKSWVDGGSPEGNPQLMPPDRKWTDAGWFAGKPDLVLTMPEPFEVKATLQDGYAFFVFNYVFPVDTWIKGLEVRPGDRGAVHHANVYIVPADIKTMPNGQIEGVFDPTSMGGKFISAWEPG